MRLLVSWVFASTPTPDYWLLELSKNTPKFKKLISTIQAKIDKKAGKTATEPKTAASTKAKTAASTAAVSKSIKSSTTVRKSSKVYILTYTKSYMTYTKSYRQIILRVTLRVIL